MLNCIGSCIHTWYNHNNFCACNLYLNNSRTNVTSHFFGKHPSQRLPFFCSFCVAELIWQYCYKRGYNRDDAVASCKDVCRCGADKKQAVPCLLRLDAHSSVCYIYRVENAPVCWNWQTGRTQNPLPAMACGFKSHHRHHVTSLFFNMRDIRYDIFVWQLGMTS